MKQGLSQSSRVFKAGANTALVCILSLVPFSGSASVKSTALSRLTEDMFQRAEPTFLDKNANPVQVKATPFTEPTLALKDPDNRISPDFKVPEELEKRVGFWFDIYTKYGEESHVVHHVRYPWIVFDVIDTAPIFENANLHRWTKYHKAQALVISRMGEVRRGLRSLAKRKSYKKLSPLEQKLFSILADLPGTRKKVFALAAANVRSQLGQKDFIIKGLSYSSKYLPYMEEEFRAAGLPVELTRLPFVESSFNTSAESKVGASGIWQIMPRTGRAFLTVNEHIDERNSPLKASMVAIELFRANYKSLKDWPLAVTAYNHGVGGLKGNLKRSGSRNLFDLINRVHSGSFKFASANFFSSYLAVLHAEKYHREIFHDTTLELETPLRYSVYSLEKKMRAKQLASVVGLAGEDLLNINLDLKDALKRNGWIPKGFKVLVPFESRYQLDTKLNHGLKAVREAKNDTPVPANSRGS